MRKLFKKDGRGMLRVTENFWYGRTIDHATFCVSDAGKSSEAGEMVNRDWHCLDHVTILAFITKTSHDATYQTNNISHLIM
jgi:hypothetical protein